MTQGLSWLSVSERKAPLIISLPHTGTDIPACIEDCLVSPWLARKDADWWIDRLYDFASDLGATVVKTSISRTVIDVNRDPSGVSLYPGQAATELCPTTTFDGEPLYRSSRLPDEIEIAERRQKFFAPYHNALTALLARLRTIHDTVVLYDCHSIRSVIPRLFDGTLPHLNIGTNSGRSCDADLTAKIAALAAGSGFSHVVNGRFKGGWITRQYGRSGNGVHAVQMELACRGYMREPLGPVTENGWPTPYDAVHAGPMRGLLSEVLRTCLQFAQTRTQSRTLS